MTSWAKRSITFAKELQLQQRLFQQWRWYLKPQHWSVDTFCLPSICEGHMYPDKFHWPPGNKWSSFMSHEDGEDVVQFSDCNWDAMQVVKRIRTQGKWWHIEMNPSGHKPEKEEIPTTNITETSHTITLNEDWSCWHFHPEVCWRSITPKKMKFYYIRTLNTLLIRLSCINFKC